MANISKIKREKMLTFIKNLKESANDEDVISSLSEIENELCNKKYGLVWEEHEEEVNLKLIDNVPVFSECTEKEIITTNDKDTNFILEGDNLHSLYLLNKTCKESFDCIYIDPPYNTGAKDWKYNNNYVDKTSTYRHSKWISMMHCRMELAKNLLKDDGVFICAIDENELGTLLLLIEDVFGIGYSIDPVVVVHNPRGIQGDNFSYINEYAIFVYKKGAKVIEDQSVEEADIDWSPLRNWGTESERLDAANCFYPIYVKNGNIVGFGDDVTSVSDFHPKQTEYDAETDTYAIYPIDVEGVERKWRYARQSVEKIINLLRVKTTETGYDIELGKNFIPYKTVWTDKRMDANEYGTQLIKSMVPNNDFSFPKSVFNVYECLRAVTLNRPNAKILDYFAGSGTTGHATLLLNKELGGNRRFVLCTNNDIGDKKEKQFKKEIGDVEEHIDEWNKWVEKYGIASSVTYPRIKAAINGYTHKKDFKEILFQQKITPSVIKKSDKLLTKVNEIISENLTKYDKCEFVVEDGVAMVIASTKKNNKIEGISANLKYYKTSFVSKNNDDLRYALMNHIREMVQLEFGVIVDDNNYILILTDEDADKLEEEWNTKTNLQGIYMSSEVLFTSEQSALFNTVPIKTIPDYFFNIELKEVGESW